MGIRLKLGVTANAGFGGRNNEYRYWLTREWDERLKRVCWIMLNPSTADADSDDPTLVKVQTFSRLWGYGSCVVVNLFAFRSTLPLVMKEFSGNPEGAYNNDVILESARNSSLVVCAWGRDGSFRGRGKEVLAMLAEYKQSPHVLKINKDGSPMHPLYVAYETKLIPMEASA